MEKVVYAMSPGESDSEQEFAERLVTELAPRLKQIGAHQLTIAVHDTDVAAAGDLRIARSEPPIAALIGIWVDSANNHSEIERVLESFGTGIFGYLVAESEPLNDSERPEAGGRTPGMMQIAFLQVPRKLTKDKWFSIWRGDHTDIAIATQSTFVYRQNLVVRALTEGAPDFAAIVEEAFPKEAMRSQHVFYDAIGDDAKLNSNRKRLWESSKRFVDLSTLEVLPTSEYVWR